MKLNILYIIILGLLSFDISWAQNIEIPDRSFKYYLVDNFDKNYDNEISITEAKSVQTIDCSSRGIKSLEGIQYFTKHLQSLNMWRCFIIRIT